MSTGYLPSQRARTTTYTVHTIDDRLFSPELAPTSTITNQLAKYQALVGTGKVGATVASEEVIT